MKLVFKKLNIENFMSIGVAEIDFESMVGFNTIIGENNMKQDNAKSNGSGKSSIFEALIWCLTGETIRGNKDVVNHNTDGGTKVSVTFESNGHTYEIERYKNHHQFKTNLFIKVDGEDKSGKGIRDSEKLLESYLPELTASLIGSVIVLGQGLPSRFTNNTPSARKEVLEKLTQSDFMIEDIKSHVSARKTELDLEVRQHQDELLRYRTLVSVTEKALDDLRCKLSDFDDIPAKRKKLNDTLEEYEILKKNVSTYIADYDSLDKQCSDLTSEYNSLETIQNNELLVIKNEHSEKSSALQSDLAVAKSTILTLERKIADAKMVTDICPTCHQKLPGVFIPDTESDEVELEKCRAIVLDISNKVQSLREEYLVYRWTEVEHKYKQKLHDMKEQLFKLCEKRTDASNIKVSAESAVRKMESKIVGIESEIAYCETSRESVISDISSNELKLEELQDKIRGIEESEIVTQQHLAVINKFETIIKRDFRGYLLQDIIVYIDKRAKAYSNTIFGTDLISFTLDGNNIAISYNGKSYEALSGGERQKVDIIVQFAIRDVLCAYTNFHTNIIVLDEIFDNLDDIGSKKVIDLITHQLTDISSIFIISHHAKELNLPYDREIIVSKDENGVSTLL